MKGFSKDGNWIEGKVTRVNPQYGTIWVYETCINLRDIPQKIKDSIDAGTFVRITFGESQYYAKNVEIKGVKMEPQEPKIDVSKLTPEEKREIRGIMERCLVVATSIYDITATYDDTKKDMDKISESIIETTVALTIAIDGLTTQIIKKG